MLDFRTDYLATLPAFLAYFATGLVLLVLFVVLYTLITPHREWALIRAGNLAAATSLSGAMLGFLLPLASVVMNSLNLIDMAVWAGVALVIQLLTFVAVRLALPGLSRKIEAGDPAAAVILAASALGIGVLNAACMTY